MTQKKAILMVSFGTSYLDSKRKTIDRILEDVTENFPDHKIYQAWTSKMILTLLKSRDNIHIPSLEEAMAEITAAGTDHLIVQPTHLINGLENEVMKRTISKHAPHNLKVAFGDPLLTTTEDHRKALNCLISEYSTLPRNEALVLMGHGSAHYANSVYAALDYMLKEMGYPNIFMGTVEAYPDLNTLITQVKKTPAKRVHLCPFMLVAGDHANHDMAGEQEDSWKSLFESAGYQVICHLKGLGEYKEIREIYLEHLKKATAD
ncbi:MAG: sirohydrochlorin cobaltochelatase [Lachnospiraceae bacterium]|nr:sirohydrochlorin cobaltochelatase [Lachnospiraceae bacterium]